MNGGHCEVLIHDVRDLEHSIIYVTQPSITGRHRGNGMTDYALQLVRSGRFLTEPFVVNYVGGTQERVLRSSTYFIKDQGELAGLLCVNIEVDHLLQGICLLYTSPPGCRRSPPWRWQEPPGLLGTLPP